MPPNLPGYYFDAEKNRYFKIQPNHIAPSGSRYSRQAVKAEKVIKKAQRRDESIRRSKSATTVTRSRILLHPLLSFDRQLGNLRKRATISIAEYYAASLHGGDAFSSFDYYNPASPTDPEAVRQWSASPESGCFAIDHDSGTLFSDFAWKLDGYQHGGPDMHAFHRDRFPFDEKYLPAAPHVNQWRISTRADDAESLYGLAPYDTIARVHGVENIVSVGSGLVVWVEGCRLDQFPQVSCVKVGACRSGAFANRHDLVHESVFYSRVQDLAVQPPSGQGHHSYLVALATGSGLWLMDTSDWRYPTAHYPLHDGTNDIMKITFKDHNILMGGTRSGRMLLCDIREPPSDKDKGGRSSATRIQHSSAITALRVLPDGNKILVSGLSSMKIYDLRYTPSPALKCHLPRANSYRESPSVLTFHVPETRRQNQYGLGFAYDPELNIVVRASTDHVKNHRVGIWSCNMGRLISSPLNEYVFGGPVVCADIARVRDGPKSVILSTSSAGIMEWTVQGRGGDLGQER